MQKSFDELAITNRRRDHLYFTMIPNVVFFFALSPADILLYNIIVKTTGPDGANQCFKTTETLAAESGLGIATISRSKANLERVGLIRRYTRKRSKGGRPIDHLELVDVWRENVLFFSEVYSPDEKIPKFLSLEELRNTVFSTVETEEEQLKKNQTSEEEKEEEPIFSTPISPREQTLNGLSWLLEQGVPDDLYLYKPWEKALDSIAAGTRKALEKKTFDSECAQAVHDAIEGLVGKRGQYPLRDATSPTRPVIEMVLKAVTNGKKKATARAEWREAAERGMAALEAKQVQTAKRDPWWEGILAQLQGQMDRATFDACLWGSQLLERADGRIVVGVANEYARQWLDNRLRPLVERAVAVDGIGEVEFRVV